MSDAEKTVVPQTPATPPDLAAGAVVTDAAAVAGAPAGAAQTAPVGVSPVGVSPAMQSIPSAAVSAQTPALIPAQAATVAGYTAAAQAGSPSPIKALHAWIVIILLALILAVSAANLVMQVMPLGTVRGGAPTFVSNDGFAQGPSRSTSGSVSGYALGPGEYTLENSSSSNTTNGTTNTI